MYSREIWQCTTLNKICTLRHWTLKAHNLTWSTTTRTTPKAPTINYARTLMQRKKLQSRKSALGYSWQSKWKISSWTFHPKFYWKRPSLVHSSRKDFTWIMLSLEATMLKLSSLVLRLSFQWFSAKVTSLFVRIQDPTTAFSTSTFSGPSTSTKVQRSL